MSIHTRWLCTLLLCSFILQMITCGWYSDDHLIDEMANIMKMNEIVMISFWMTCLDLTEVVMITPEYDMVVISPEKMWWLPMLRMRGWWSLLSLVTLSLTLSLSFSLFLSLWHACACIQGLKKVNHLGQVQSNPTLTNPSLTKFSP